ncbi:IclR family transcriptional regulator [Devosia sp.]|uniref:IclR family transcriptional regulator n=1 Tax=Devosia sp. TaxID=1871048 RepID=UPI001ACA7D84|nr:IclR family transcriptional regulator [Devosia sp.]MBN9308551.1 IclR family transcriptional regulator [Devosia sp.]
MARRPKAQSEESTPAPAAKPVARRQPASDKPAYTAPALEKGLDVLELLATLSAPVTPSQIAQRLGRSLQEVYRVVLALERRGYLLRPPGEEALVLSTQLFGLATLFPPFRRVVDAAQPIMNALALETSQEIHMAVVDGLNQRIIAQVDSPAPIAIRLRVGAASPAVRGTSGRTIVAFQPAPVQQWILEQSETIVPPEQLSRYRQRIAHIAVQGYERIEGEVVQGVTDLSFPIINAAGVSLAALTMPFLASQQVIVPFDDAAAMLFRAARRISELMGGELREPTFPLPAPDKAR